ncbi:MAG: nitrate reductase [Parvularcula sp.]
MSLLDFARGPALMVAVTVFSFGVFWRITRLLIMGQKHDLTPARPGTRNKYAAGLREIFRRMWPDEHPQGPSFLLMLNSYVFHIGLVVVVLFFRQHILFIKSITGLSWPGLPSDVIYAVGVVTIASLVIALAARLMNPVQKLISTWDDYLTWFLTLLPVLSGLAAASHIVEPYDNLLAFHLLSVSALLIWFPFGKFMHAFIVFLSRSKTGIHLNHRGAQL